MLGGNKANNNLLAPGTLYRKELHEIIGEPNLKLFKGAGDMEYWARMLLYEQKGYYHPIPLWLYRNSEYDHSNLGGFEDFNKTILKFPLVINKQIDHSLKINKQHDYSLNINKMINFDVRR